MKTTIEYYNELPDGYRQLAIKNCPPDILHSGCTSMGSALCSFMWEHTDEGSSFWYKVYEKAVARSLDKQTTQEAKICIFDKIREWGYDKGIVGKNSEGTLLGQLAKTQEELTETRDAAVAWDLLQTDYRLEDIKDGIGDCVVTLVLAAELAGLDIEDCIEHAYNEIKNRTGRMEGGIFIKDQ